MTCRRTQDAIVEQINLRKSDDLFGFEWHMYLEYLDFEHARQFLKDDVTAEKWCSSTKTPSQQIIEYMPFAWEKANDQRGLSANRSIEHMIAWLWLDESPIYDAIVREYDDNYNFYGKPILEQICDHYGVNWRALDNGIRTNGNDED